MNDCMYSSAKHDWETPDELFQGLNARHGFTVDAAAHSGNHKLPRWFGPGGERPCGLAADWTGERVWLNPPYGRAITAWLDKASSADVLCVALLPARTDTAWFHRYVYVPSCRVVFLRGRLRFKGAAHPAPFPSMLAIYGAQTNA